MATKKQSICEHIVDMLPKKELWSIGDDVNYMVEPKINIRCLSECGGDIAPKTGRPLWIIAGTAFYCVYSIDHDSSVMASIGSSIHTGNVCWLASIDSDQLAKILDLINIKDPNAVTPDEINDIIDQ